MKKKIRAAKNSMVSLSLVKNIWSVCLTYMFTIAFLVHHHKYIHQQLQLSLSSSFFDRILIEVYVEFSFSLFCAKCHRGWFWRILQRQNTYTLYIVQCFLIGKSFFLTQQKTKTSCWGFRTSISEYYLSKAYNSK